MNHDLTAVQELRDHRRAEAAGPRRVLQPVQPGVREHEHRRRHQPDARHGLQRRRERTSPTAPAASSTTSATRPAGSSFTPQTKRQLREDQPQARPPRDRVRPEVLLLVLAGEARTGLPSFFRRPGGPLQYPSHRPARCPDTWPGFYSFRSACSCVAAAGARADPDRRTDFDRLFARGARAAAGRRPPRRDRHLQSRARHHARIAPTPCRTSAPPTSASGSTTTRIKQYEAALEGGSGQHHVPHEPGARATTSRRGPTRRCRTSSASWRRRPRRRTPTWCSPTATCRPGRIRKWCRC